MNTIIESARKELESQYIEAGVIKWGECERGYLQKQARRKSLKTLMIDNKIRELAAVGATNKEIMAAIDKIEGPLVGSLCQAAHCNADGPT